MAQILFPNFFVNYKLGPWGLSKLPAHNTNPPKWIQNMQIVGTWLTLIKEAQTVALKLFDQQRKQGYANLGGGEINQLKLPLAEFVLPLAWSITHTSALLPYSSSPSSFLLQSSLQIVMEGCGEDSSHMVQPGLHCHYNTLKCIISSELLFGTVL